ncbi:MAG: DUF4118 domain-containing protein [Lachnospira sp.]|nr:DUF4118 domain-containing protein [Lachnospira sp.]
MLFSNCRLLVSVQNVEKIWYTIKIYCKGYFYGILSSVVCLLCFNYFFTAPYHTLAVNDPSYMITEPVQYIQTHVGVGYRMMKVE